MWRHLECRWIAEKVGGSLTELKSKPHWGSQDSPMLPRLTEVEEDNSKAWELDTQKCEKTCKNGSPPTRNKKHARLKELPACGQLSPSASARPSGGELGRQRTGGVELGTGCSEEFSLTQGSL